MSTAQTSPVSFARGLGLFSAVMLVAGAMIGSGIFLVPADIARSVGAPGWVLVVWLLTGLMTIGAAVGYGELGAMYPRAGGQYVYLREAYSPLLGFLYGWSLFMVIQTGTIAAVGVAFAKYLGVLVPWVSSSNWLVRLAQFSLGGKVLTLGLNSAQLVGLGVIALLTGNNCINLSAGKWVQNVLTTIKIAALLAIAAIGLCSDVPGGALHATTGLWQAASGAQLNGMPLIVAVGCAMVGSLFSADAWNNITFVAAEVKKPQRDVPLALMFGAGGVVLLYLLVNVAYLNLLPMEEIANAPENAVAAVAMQRLVPWGGRAIAVIVMISTFGCLNAMILTGPRLYYAMAKDGLFFKAAGKLGARSRVPGLGLGIQGLWACLLTLSGTYSDLLDYVIFVAVLFYVLTVLGLLMLRRRLPEFPRPYRTLGYPVVPVLYLLAGIALMLILLIHKPLYTWPGLGIVALGIPVFVLWKRRQA